MSYKTPPPEGDIVLPPLTINSLNNGQIRMMTKASGAKFSQIRALFNWQTDDTYLLGDDGEPLLNKKGEKIVDRPGKGPYDGPVDEADVVWAMGKIALEIHGYEPSDENADRVRFEKPDEDPTTAQ